MSLTAIALLLFLLGFCASRMSLRATALLTFLLGFCASRPTPIVGSVPIPARVPAGPVRSVPVVYDAIRDQLRPSGVPVLLPVQLPRGIEAARSISVVAADRSGYTVGFSSEAHCFEALSCSFFHVSGFARAALSDRSYLHDRPVRLSDGTRGFFRPQDCSGASCSEASLTFERFCAIYEIDVKVGHEDLLVLERAYTNLHRLR